MDDNTKRPFIEGPSVDWRLRTRNKVRSGLRVLEKLTLRAERPVGKVVGSPRLNPLYHTGTISVFLFGVVFITGLYLTAFFQYGFAASYEAVGRLETNLVGRLIRAIHRYASVALVVTSLLHGWRTFFQDRFRGARWVAWVSGVAMMVLLWVVGVTGYWLIWDERAQVLNGVFTRAVEGSNRGLDFLIDNLLSPVAATGWPFLLLIFLIHVGLSIGVGVLIWVHLKRLSRAKVLPPRFWMTIIGGAIVVASILWPLGMLPALNVDKLPGTFPLDPFYLFLMPAGLELSPSVLWGGFLVLTGVITALPWLLRREPLDPIVVHEDRCTGCTLCVADCPYDALEMVPRSDDAEYRQLAIVHEDRCIACGVCIGSCPEEALTLGEMPAEELWDEVLRLSATADQPHLVITCERHSLQGARHHLGENGVALNDGRMIHVVPVPCIGMVHPRLVGSAIDAGAGEVQLVGCPPGDCANREGNTWMQARLNRDRVPRLKRRYLDEAIASDWVAPDQFLDAIKNPGNQSIADPEEQPELRRLIPVLALVMAVTLVSIAATNIRFTPGTANDSVIAIAMDHRAGAPIMGYSDTEPALEDGVPPRLLVEVDGEAVFDKAYAVVGADGIDTSLAYEQIAVEPGAHRVRISLFDRTDPAEVIVLFDDTIGLAVGEIFNLAINDSSIEAESDAGRSLYLEGTLGTNAGCRICHSLDEGVVLVGPSFAGIASRATARVPGLTAEEYLRQSILDPNAYVVEGFPAGQMLQNFDELLTEEDIDNLVAFLLTLE
ncbi:MAG: hydrogenase iron-sulfur subunit [Actinomycetota bacterium]|nr:hydrogenase iron-sulfur subunit [Actinomycetota bacterium]